MEENPKSSTNNNPHFYKMIMEHTLKQNKLWIPDRFVRKCGETLKESVFVKVSCGSKWKMKLKYYDQKFWLEEGWADFANYYNIKRGYMLMFRYDGNSEFYVVILDITTVEIDYPSAPSPAPLHFDAKRLLTPKKEVMDGDFDDSKKLLTPKKEVMDGDFVENFDEFSPCNETKMVLALPMPCSQPIPMIMQTSHNDQFQLAIVPQPDEYIGQNPIRSQKIPQNSQSRMREQIENSPRRGKTSRIPEHVKQLKGDEKLAALQMASGFRSTRPFFKVLMQPSLVYDNRLSFPSTFAKKYIPSTSCDVSLKVLEGRSWCVKYKFENYGGRAAARLRTGWNKFAKDNNLEVGDVCVFVLLEVINVVFEVVIFRLNGDSKIPISYM
ncbi:B3 domain-containing transcription factor VRN1-like [Humulus lupulus]|uniref:B3 domain-containing transcription factor VRN1-like n=1 Tax=Humulus lupulus TaxID=3486 RepID=UPI002B40EE55|nr:B3 domain-containing transcription factor VRN1-like [Humulus lupulus]